MKIPKVQEAKPWPKTNIGHEFLKDICPLLYWKPSVEIKGKDLEPNKQ